MNAPKIDDSQVYCVHLGVSSKAICFNLEHCAYNTMDFRVPDETGNQPTGTVIDNRFELESVKSTSYPIDDFRNRLCMLNYDVCKSSDPGRFLCNYVYYSSLQKCHNQQAIFIHVPPCEVIPLDIQIRFITDFINILLEYATGNASQCDDNKK